MTIQTIKRTADYARMARLAYSLRKSDNEQVCEHARRHLIQQMGKMRGLPQKLGQMLSFANNSGKDSHSSDFSLLQENAEPLPLESVQPIIEQAWGQKIQSIVASIDPKARAGSLGQVHRATLLDGREVAVKVQYPGIRNAVMTDLKALGWLSIPIGNLRRGFDLASYRRVIQENLERELDYLQEANSHRELGRWAENEPSLVVPCVIDELCTENVLVTEWREGEHWQEVCDRWSDDKKQQLAVAFSRFFLQGLFVQGKIQADWHPGNFRFRYEAGSAQIVLYDLGCICRPTDSERFALGRLIRATIHGDESPWPLFLKLGFQRDLLEPLQDKLPALCRTLFEPFTVEHPYNLADWNLDHRVKDVLGSDRMNFRIAGPANLVFLIRAFHGLTYYLSGLGTPIQFRRAFETCVLPIQEAMTELELSADDSDCGFDTLAQHMKICVRSHGRTKVKIKLRASAIENLEEYLDQDLRKRLDRRGVHLPSLVSEIRQRGYAPGPVFNLVDGTKSVCVALE